MTKEINLGLQGEFKCDLYKNGKLESSTDYFSNFITQTGLTYPSIYAFADCFRYLSIGRSAVANSGSMSLSDLGTTGLYDPIGTFRDSNNVNQSANYINWRGYVSGGDVPACGTVVTEGSPRFYRAWYIPTGADPTITMNEPAAEGLTIGEFMVSPDSGNSVGGKAFSRVVRNLFIPNGYRAVISYQLRVKINDTGIKTFSGGSFATGDADLTNDSELIQGWANLSGYYRQVYHGLRCVDKYGVTYIPKMGDAMEPSSKNIGRMSWYLSPDNSQFDVNSVAGGPQLSVSSGYRADGLMATIKTLNLKDVTAESAVANSTLSQDLTKYYHQVTPSLSSSPTETVPFNIRIGSTATVATSLTLPQIYNYKVEGHPLVAPFYSYQVAQEGAGSNKPAISYATPGVKGYRTDLSDFGEQAVFSSFTSTLPISKTGQNLITGRKKTIVRRSVFAPIQSLGYNTRFGSMVYGFNNGLSTAGQKTFYPNIDVLFYDTSGRAQMPHFRYFSGFQSLISGTGIIQASGYLSNSTGRVTDFWKTLQTGNTAETYASTPNAGNITVLGEVFSGWGGVTGMPTVKVPGNVALVDHSLIALTEPAITGQLYWPYINTASKLNLNFTGMKYFSPDIAVKNNSSIVGGVFEDSGNWFDLTHQMVKRVDFTMYKDSILTGKITVFSTGIPTGIAYYSNTTGAPVSSNNLQGYYVTTRQFTGNFTGNDFRHIIKQADNFSLTGYVIPKNIIAGKISGTTWLDQGNNPTNSNFFTIPTSGRTLTADGNSYARVENLFSSNTARGFTFGTGGTAIRANDPLAIYFTGFSGTNPIYLSYILYTQGEAFPYRDCVSPTSYGSDFINCPATYAADFSQIFGDGSIGTCACYKDLTTDPIGLTGAYSIMSGTLQTTTFSRPSGFVTHNETNVGPISTTGFRLQPNFSYPVTGLTAIPEVNYGGSLPSLSFDNGLSVDLILQWSSPCTNSVINCLDPV